MYHCRRGKKKIGILSNRVEKEELKINGATVVMVVGEEEWIKSLIERDKEREMEKEDKEMEKEISLVGFYSIFWLHLVDFLVVFVILVLVQQGHSFFNLCNHFQLAQLMYFSIDFFKVAFVVAYMVASCCRYDRKCKSVFLQ